MIADYVRYLYFRSVREIHLRKINIFNGVSIRPRTSIQVVPRRAWKSPRINACLSKASKSEFLLITSLNHLHSRWVKLTSVGSKPVLGMKVKQRKNVWLFWKITISMEGSQRHFLMVIDRSIISYIPITVFPRFIVISLENSLRDILNDTAGEAFDSAKIHKRLRRKRQSVTAKREKSQTPKFV